MSKPKYTLPTGNIKNLEGLSAYIDGLLDRSAAEIYLINKKQNTPKVARAVQGLFGEDQPTIVFRSGNSDVDALFYQLIDPKNITGKVRRGGREAECNLIWSDICRNGAGPNQYERISMEARRLALEELEKEDETGEKALTYLENKALDSSQRWRARRDWVELLGSYAHRERITRDPSYVQYHEKLMSGETIDVEAVRIELPKSATAERLYLIAEKILKYELKKAAKSKDFSDYEIRLDLVGVFDTMGTPNALQDIKERLYDPKEDDIVKAEAAEVLSIDIKN